MPTPAPTQDTESDVPTGFMSTLTLDDARPVAKLSAADKAATTKRLYIHEPYLDPSKESSSRPWYLTPERGYIAWLSKFLTSMEASLSSNNRPTRTKTRSRSRIASLPSADTDTGDEAAPKPEETEFICLSQCVNAMMKTLALAANTGVETEQEPYRRARTSLTNVSKQVHEFACLEGLDENSQRDRAVVCVGIVQTCNGVLPDLQRMEAEIERLKKEHCP